MTPEDIGDIFQALEDALFAMAIRTMKHHENWEQEEGFQWTQWQAEQIQGLRAYRQNVKELTDYYFNLAKKGIESYLRQAYRNSIDDAAETARALMLQNGRMAQFSQQFFGVNSKKLDVLINEAVQNIDTKRYAAINRMNYGYTEMLRRADIFAQSGSFTIPQAVDMAANDFLSAGLNCVEYSNGNRVNIASYAEMALRTSSSEVTRQANGDVRDELGEYLVVSNVIGITCPICQKWQGKVMIDDVYSNGKPDGKHKLVSESKTDGFMHPNCRHQLFMYIEGVTNVADLPNDVQTRERYDAEQKQRYYERQIRKYKRLRDGAVDPANRKKYDARVKEWTAKHDEHIAKHDYLRKNPKRLAPGYTGNGKPSGIPPKMSDAEIDKKVLELRHVQESISGWGKKEDIIRDFGDLDSYFGADMSEQKQKFIDVQNEIDKLLTQRSKPELVINGKTIGDPMTIDEALKGSNPNFNKGGEYITNCQRCVQTYEFRRRGYDVEALPDTNSGIITWGNECFVDVNGSVPKFKIDFKPGNIYLTEQNIRDELAAAPNGSRHIIYIQWDGTQNAHVFIAEKEGEVTRFIDPQSGDNDVEHYFTLGREGAYNILRIDDKQLTDDMTLINATMR